MQLVLSHHTFLFILIECCLIIPPQRYLECIGTDEALGNIIGNEIANQWCKSSGVEIRNAQQPTIW